MGSSKLAEYHPSNADNKRDSQISADELVHWPAAKMRQGSRRGVLASLNWEDLRTVQAAAESGSFRKAAETIGKDAATVTRRIKRLESIIGEKLFQIHPTGVKLTSVGTICANATAKMDMNFVELLRDLEHIEPHQAGIVRVAITEGLGTYWVMPRLVEFQRANPRMTIDLRCAMEGVDVLRHETDIAIQFDKPDSSELIVTKLGRLHIYPFASTKYKSVYGTPKSLEDMRNHRLVDQSAPQIDSGVWPKLLGLESIENIVGIRTNASSAILFAIEKGAGIGALPTYAPALGANVVPIDVGIKHHMDIWLTYHPSLKDVDRIATVVKWLRRVFDSRRFPWFRDEFIHPAHLIDMLPEGYSAEFGRDFLAANPA